MPALPRLIIVSGLPATGKSTLAAQLRDQLGLPLIARDALKEVLAESLPPDLIIDRALSVQLGHQSRALLFAFGRELLESGVSCIIESNFIPWLAGPELEPLVAISRAHQVHCTIPAHLVLERYALRAGAGGRHAIHTDQAATADLEQRIADGGGEPVPLKAPLLQVTTANGLDPAFPEIVAFCTT